MRVMPGVIIGTTMSRRKILFAITIGLVAILVFGFLYFNLRKKRASIEVAGISDSSVVVGSGKTDQNAPFISQALEEYMGVDVSTLTDDKKIEHYTKLASLYKLNGDNQNAYDTYKKVDELLPNNAGIKLGLAEQALSIGKKSEAKVYYLAAKDLYSKNKTDTSQQSIDEINKKLATL